MNTGHLYFKTKSLLCDLTFQQKSQVVYAEFLCKKKSFFSEHMWYTT